MSRDLGQRLGAEDVLILVQSKTIPLGHVALVPSLETQLVLQVRHNSRKVRIF